jgi:hypothetical protein
MMGHPTIHRTAHACPAGIPRIDIDRLIRPKLEFRRPVTDYWRLATDKWQLVQ